MYSQQKKCIGTNKMLTVQELKEKFGVRDNTELARELNCTAQAISNWNATGIPALAERKALAILKQKGIVAEPITPYQVETKKVEHTPVAEVILDVTDKLTPDGQTKALEAVTAIFIAEQIKGKS
jgi:hypothetical protein